MARQSRFKIRLKDGKGDTLVLGGAVPDLSPVTLYIDGVACGTSQPVPPKPGKTRPTFKFAIKNVRNVLRDGMALSVRQGGRIVPDVNGDAAWVVPENFASGALPVVDLVKSAGEGLQINKKGHVSRPVTDDAKDRYLKAYRFARDWFDRQLGYAVLVSHGTLLGLYRSGDLIPNDDDFDCLYLSAKTDTAGIVAERVAILEAMRRSGLKAEVGKTGHIKLRSHACRLDLMPAWLAGDTLNISGYTSMPGGRALVRNPGTLPFRDGQVGAFADPEPFLVHQYGAGWRHPNPGFRSIPSGAERANRQALRPKPAEIIAFGGASLRLTLPA